MMNFRYSRWDGTQQVAPFDAEDMLNAMSDDLLSDGDLQRALRRLMQWGGETQDGQKIMGLQELRERLRQQRRQQLDRYDLSGILDELKEKLDKVLETERQGIERRLAEARGERPKAPFETDDAADDSDGDSMRQSNDPFGSTPDGQEGDDEGQRGGGPSNDQRNQQGQRRSSGGQGGGESSGDQSAEPTDQSGGPMDDWQRKMLEQIASRKRDQLDQLPNDFGGQVRGLMDYEFMEPKAREQFQEILDMLQKHMLNRAFQGIQQSLNSMTPQDLQGINEMLKDLNQMLRDRAQGKDPNFSNFMEKHGQYFPPGIQNLDELLEHLARQMSAMQSLLNSMSADQRQQLQDAMQGMMNNQQLQQNLQELSQLLAQMMPGMFSPQRYPFRGDESISMDEAMRLMENLQDIDQLDRELRNVRDYEDLDRIDSEKIRQLLGDDEAQQLDEIKRLMETLEEAGMIERKNDKFQLTPRAIRKIGDKALKDIFGKLKRNGFGNHQAREVRGVGGERLDETKRYEFGDPFLMDIQRTVMNGVMRAGAGSPVVMSPQDFEVYRTELVTQSATVLLLDMSRSMLLRGCFLAAKKVALALQSLIKSQYPKDQLLIVGFSFIARELKPESLPGLYWEEYEYGTNLQHGLQIAREYLAKQRAANKEIIVITDGEPTAHFENGRVQFAYPPTFRTIQETLREVRRCTRERVTINTFMLETGDYLMDFVDQMTKINKGRAFFATPERLGEYILVDYVSNKRKKIS